jgi:hypothetical protein
LVLPRPEHGADGDPRIAFLKMVRETLAHAKERAEPLPAAALRASQTPSPARPADTTPAAQAHPSASRER